MSDNITKGPASIPCEYESIAAELFGTLPDLVEQMMGGQVRGYVEAKDIVQDVWIKSRDALKTFSPQTADIRGDIRALFSRIARNTVIDYVRRCDKFVTAVEADIFDDARKDGMTPSRVVAKDQAFATLRDCLAKLNTDEREVLRRRFDVGQAYADIAHEMKRSVDQIDRTLRRAKRHLRQMLGSSSDFRFALAQP